MLPLVGGSLDCNDVVSSVDRGNSLNIGRRDVDESVAISFKQR